MTHNHNKETMASMIEQIYVCVDGEVIVSTEDPLCPSCGKAIKPVGWIESEDDE